MSPDGARCSRGRPWTSVNATALHRSQPPCHVQLHDVEGDPVLHDSRGCFRLDASQRERHRLFVTRSLRHLILTESQADLNRRALLKAGRLIQSRCDPRMRAPDTHTRDVQSRTSASFTTPSRNRRCTSPRLVFKCRRCRSTFVAGIGSRWPRTCHASG
jgi:hypothetical protein